MPVVLKTAVARALPKIGRIRKCFHGVEGTCTPVPVLILINERISHLHYILKLLKSATLFK